MKAKDSVTVKDILWQKKQFTNIHVMAHLALEAGYRYFEWSGSIYQINHNSTVSIQNDLTEKFKTKE